jgi:hypothetical protein
VHQRGDEIIARMRASLVDELPQPRAHGDHPVAQLGAFLRAEVRGTAHQLGAIDGPAVEIARPIQRRPHQPGDDLDRELVGEVRDEVAATVTGEGVDQPMTQTGDLLGVAVDQLRRECALSQVPQPGVVGRVERDQHPVGRPVGERACELRAELHEPDDLPGGVRRGVPQHLHDVGVAGDAPHVPFRQVEHRLIELRRAQPRVRVPGLHRVERVEPSPSHLGDA